MRQLFILVMAFTAFADSSRMPATAEARGTAPSFKAHTRTGGVCVSNGQAIVFFTASRLVDASSLLPGNPGNHATMLRTDELLHPSGIRFTENRGQIVDTDGNIRNDIAFVANARGARLYFRSDGISYVFTNAEERAVVSYGNSLSFRAERGIPGLEVISQPAETGVRNDKGDVGIQKDKLELYRLDMTLVGSNPHARVRAEGELAGYVNYYLPHCPGGITGVKEYRRIVYENIYDNIDLELFSVDGRVKYNFVVRPGGHAANIRMRYEGATKTAITSDGACAVATPVGRVEEAAPYTYAGNEDNEVASRFVRTGNIVSFAVDPYDRSETLVIDPWATYYGGSNTENAGDIATDGNGNVYVCGGTSSADFPVQNAFQNTNAGGRDAFIVKFNSGGVREWATYYGGSMDDNGEGIAVDGNGNVAICGYTGSPNFPVQNAFQGTHAGRYDAFVVKLNTNGVRQWATYYGGSHSGKLTDPNNFSGHDLAFGISIDGIGNVLFCGSTTSANFPVQNAFQNKLSGNGTGASRRDAFLVKFNSSGARQWATYCGGTALDASTGIAVDGSGNALFCGYTQSTNFPVQSALQSANGGGQDAFVAKFSGSGSRLWATYYGGGSMDGAADIAADGSGNALVCGSTGSGNFPVQYAQQGTMGGSGDAFIVKISTSGSRLWATYYGGSAEENGNGISSDGSGNAVVTGWTTSTDFPVHNALQATNVGEQDAFVAKFDGSGVRQWATYYGGSWVDQGAGIATDGSGNVVVCGATESTDFPVLNAYQSSLSGNGSNADAFFIHLNANGLFSKQAEQTETIPVSLALDQNYPNPFNPSTTIRYALTESRPVKLMVYDVLGHEVATLADEVQNAGVHAVVFRPEGLGSGLYTYVLIVEGQRSSRTMLLLK